MYDSLLKLLFNSLVRLGAICCFVGIQYCVLIPYLWLYVDMVVNAINIFAHTWAVAWPLQGVGSQTPDGIATNIAI